MTFAVGHVQGGSNAGWRIVKQPTVWVCCCKREHTTYSAPCCGDRRPAS